MGNSFSRDSIGQGLDNMRLANNFFEALGPPFTCQYKIGHEKEDSYIRCVAFISLSLRMGKEGINLELVRKIILRTNRMAERVGFEPTVPG